jgi:hypothetical protein
LKFFLYFIFVEKLNPIREQREEKNLAKVFTKRFSTRLEKFLRNRFKVGNREREKYPAMLVCSLSLLSAKRGKELNFLADSILLPRIEEKGSRRIEAIRYNSISDCSLVVLCYFSTAQQRRGRLMSLLRKNCVKA